MAIVESVALRLDADASGLAGLGLPTRTRWRARKLVLGGGFIALLLLIWEIYSRAAPNNVLIVSSPTRVAEAFATIVSDPEFWSRHLTASAQGFVAGWTLAVVVGLVLGILMGWYAPFRDAVEPFFFALKSVPGIALIPLLIVWFGFGFNYKVAVVVLVAFFSLLLNVIAGIRNSDRQLLRMARSFGARDHQLLFTVALPGAIPFIVTGLRQSVTHGVVGVVVAEYFASSAGLGWLIADAASKIQTERILATVVIVTLTGATLNEVLLRVERHLGRWRPVTEATSRAEPAGRTP